MSRWTSDQLNAINAENRSVIVSAAAGSGKTSVLVARLIRIISEREIPVPVEKMIVVTFTNDAAAEMKQRLSSELSVLIEKNPSDKWLSRQQSMLPNASISTIHSFCFDLIRDNISTLPLSSDFRIIDETEENVLRDNVLKELMDSYYEKRPDDMKLLNDNFCGNNDKPLCRIILDLYNNISSIPFYKKWISKLDDIYDKKVYLKQYTENVLKRLKYCEHQLETAYKTALKISNNKILTVLDDDKVILEKVTHYFKEKDYKNLAEFFSKLKYKNFPPAPKDGAGAEERQAIKNIREYIKNEVKILGNITGLFYNYDDDIMRHKQIMSVLSDMISDFSDMLLKLKERKNAIGFDDAEQIALNLLAEYNESGNIVKTKLAEELSDYYQIIMIDEFQDSNNRQDMIFRLLSKGGTASGYGNNLFFVGDVKQSIYRFRLANPDNFINAVNSAVPYKEDDTRNSYIKLNRNFRSSGEVIDFVNYIFKNIMSEESGDIEYNENEFLVQGASFSESRRNTQILLVDKSDKTCEDPEVICIAEKICRMLDDKTPVSINGGKSSRPCDMRDFCILLRNRKKIPVYAKALESLGITVNCEDASGYLKSREVSVLINLLKVIDNPLSDIPITSIMLSPMFMFNIDEVSEIRLIDKNKNIYSNICTGLGTDGKNPLFDENSIIYSKMKFIYNVITELRLYSSFCTLPELIQKIYDSTDFLSVIQLYKDSDRKRANLRMLLEYANSYENNSSGGVSGFVRYIDKIMESKGDFKSGNSAAFSQNGVFIKTMHKSKGLEFPFVFIAETSTKFSVQDTLKPFQFSYDLGIGFKLQNKERYEKFTTIPYEMISTYNQKKMLSEEMRLFYVALTRAKERLFITLDTEEKEAEKAADFAAEISACQGISPGLVLKARSMSDWLLMTLISHKSSGMLREKFGIYECFTNESQLEIDYENFVPHDESGEIREIKEFGLVQADDKAVEYLNEVFSFDYDMTRASLSAKLSVSDVSKKSSELNFSLNSPEFAKEKSSVLTGAEKGTALHKFLQFANFNNLESDFEKEKECVIKSGYISRCQAESINIEDITAFLNSDLYKMIKNSRKVIRERKFLISINDLDLNDELSEKYSGTDGMLNGIIDMIIENENSIVLVDYKTDKISDPEILVQNYEKQIYLYKKAVEKIYQRPVNSAIIYSFHLKTEIKIF
ncbi:helicase-exonuclease AddAB subunit AddA [Porcipelethomonas sp.]|uniref:helicase-exonuclease AddAB subunit AddA n=1 Tax=Porcipelethomonas sp. TaxID=2981675 RepID=UPI003EF46AD8